MDSNQQNHSDTENDWTLVSSPDSGSSASSSLNNDGETDTTTNIKVEDKLEDDLSSISPIEVGTEAAEDGGQSSSSLLHPIDTSKKSDPSTRRSVRFITSLNLHESILEQQQQQPPPPQPQSQPPSETREKSEHSTRCEDKGTQIMVRPPALDSSKVLKVVTSLEPNISTKIFRPSAKKRTAAQVSKSEPLRKRAEHAAVSAARQLKIEAANSHRQASSLASSSTSSLATPTTTSTDASSPSGAPTSPKLNQLVPLLYLALVMCLVGMALEIYMKGNSVVNERLENHRLYKDLVDSPISAHTYPDLKLLEEDLAECIGHNALDHHHHHHHNHIHNHNSNKNNNNNKDNHHHNHHHQQQQSKNSSPYQGIVCYERESEWRKRFEQLKSQRGLDLRKIIKQAKKRLTSEQLKAYHPSLRFELIVNQLEYLDYLDRKRLERANERLKAENFELMRRLNKMSQVDHSTRVASAGSQQQQHQQQSPGGQEQINSLASVELENVQLKQEIEVLRRNLAEKAGTVYVKQSIELEKCERENNNLKKFHYQVAQEVAKGLKQLDLHTIDAKTTLMDDHEHLSAQLAMTRGYLLRYSEEVGNLISQYKKLVIELSNVIMPKQQRLQQPDEQQQLDDHFLTTAAAAAASSDQNETSPLMELQVDLDPTAGGRQDDQQSIVGPPAAGVGSRSNCLNIDYDVRYNWLMRRAKLRERLRKSTGIDLLQKDIESIISAVGQSTKSSSSSAGNRNTNEADPSRGYKHNSNDRKQPHHNHNTRDHHHNHYNHHHHHHHDKWSSKKHHMKSDHHHHHHKHEHKRGSNNNYNLNQHHNKDDDAMLYSFI